MVIALIVCVAIGYTDLHEVPVPAPPAELPSSPTVPVPTPARTPTLSPYDDRPDIELGLP